MPIPTWCWACRQPQPRPRSSALTAPTCAPITPTHARHDRRTPPTNTYAGCWPPMPCCATPPAGPTMTGQPPMPPTRDRAPQQCRYLLSVPPLGGSRSRLPTAKTTPLQPLPPRHRGGPARCAATDSRDRAEHLAHTRITLTTHRGPNEHRYQPRHIRPTRRDGGEPKPPTRQGHADRGHDQATTRRSPHPTTGCPRRRVATRHRHADNPRAANRSQPQP